MWKDWLSGLVLVFWAGVCQIPWQELGDLFNRMIGNAGKNGSQVEFRIQPVEFS